MTAVRCRAACVAALLFALLPLLSAAAETGFAKAPSETPPAVAEPKPQQPEAAPAEGRAAGSIRMEALEIRGEIEHPDVFYIIPRRQATMDLGSTSKNYDAEILQPLLPGPFESRYSEGEK